MATYSTNATYAGHTSSGQNNSPCLVLLRQGTSHGFEMLSDNSQVRFPIYVEADTSLRSKGSKRIRCPSFDDVQRLLEFGYGHDDGHEYGYTRFSGGPRPQPQRMSDSVRSGNARAHARREEDAAMAHEHTHPGRQEKSDSQKPTAEPGSKTRAEETSCCYCGRSETPQWRGGPETPLCNVCGLMWIKQHSNRRKRVASH